MRTQCFETASRVRDFELNAPLSADPAQMRSWLINVYPVKTAVESSSLGRGDHCRDHGAQAF